MEKKNKVKFIELNKYCFSTLNKYDLEDLSNTVTNSEIKKKTLQTNQVYM